MRTLHKLTHRPLALCALFVGLGVLGWHLPELGSAVFAYSSSAVKAARATIAGTASAAPTTVAAQPAQPVVQAAATAVAPKAAAAQDNTKAAVEAAQAAFNAAREALRASNSKANYAALDAAQATLDAAIAARVARLKLLLAGLQNNGGTGRQDDQSKPRAAGADELIAELVSYPGNHLYNFSPPNAPNVAAPVVTPEVEPNNTSATAQTLNLAAQNVTIVGGAIGAAGDQDWFKITVAANERVWLYVDTGGTQAGGATSRDSQMTLFQADGTTTVQFNDDGAEGTGCDGVSETTLASHIGRQITTAGDFLIKLNAFSATGIINPYKLFVSKTAAVDESAEVEPNSTSATAQALTFANNKPKVITGTATSPDEDWFQISATAGNVVYLYVDGDPDNNLTGTDTSVQLRAADGTTILESSDVNFSEMDDNFTSPDETICFTIPATGTFFVRVRGFNVAPAAVNYALHIGIANSDPIVAGIPVCASPLTGILGTATSNFPKTSGTATQRVNRDGVVSACGAARTQNAPIAGSFTFDAFTVPTAAAGGPTCVTVTMNVTETTAPANYQVAAFLNTFNPANLTQNWLGDPGLSSGSPPTQTSFSVIVPQGQSIVIVVLNTNGTTGNGNAYSITTSCLQAPCVPVCPANITTNVAAGTCAASVTYPAATFTGVCNPITCTPASGSSFPKGTTTVTCTSTGNQNGTATCTFTVTVVDNIAPSLTCPADISVGTTGNSFQQNGLYTVPTATDNCPGVGVVTCSPLPNATFPVGTTTVTCTVSDAVNLTTTCTFRVHVNRLTVGSLTDPLACTGPGSRVSGSFTVTNNSNVAQTVAGTVTLGPAGPPQGLLALACTANAGGTCTIAGNQASITYNTGSLAAGASATISYILQVNDGVAPGTVLTSNVSASFNGGPAVTAGASTTANCPLAGPGAPFINNPERAVMSDQRAGSVLFYPIYTSEAAGGNTQNARISLTNTSDKLRSFVHLFFVDGATCSVSDAFICLTPNQTAAFLTSDLDPGTRGYIVAVATDALGCPVHFNYLIGEEFVKFSSGHRANLGAEAVPAIAGSTFWVSCDGSQPTATLAFNSVSYGAVPYTLAEDNLQSTVDGNNTLLVINRIGGDLQTGPARLVPIFGTLYDDQEISYSFNLATNNLCQFVSSLSDSVPRTTPRLSVINPTGRTAWFKIAGTSEIGIFGAAINFNPNTASSSAAFNGGHNLHKLTFTNAMTYTIPIFPATCN